MDDQGRMAEAPHGIYPMLYSFFQRDGSLDLEALRLQVRAAVAHGAHGVAVLGLASEVGKLSDQERRSFVEVVTGVAGQRIPVAATVAPGTVAQQIEFARFARSVGAQWVILQPPPERGEPESFYLEHFSRVIAALDFGVGIQNAPEYIGVGLSPPSILELVHRHRNFTVLKGEGPIVHVQRIIEATQGKLAVFNGRNGQELPDNLRAGCRGMIPSTCTFDYQVSIYNAMRSGDEAAAEAIYRTVLPAIIFNMQTLDTLLTYGKRMAALRLDLQEVFDRTPALVPTNFGLECVRRFAHSLGPLRID